MVPRVLLPRNKARGHTSVKDMRAAASKIVVHSQQSISDTFPNYYFKFYKMTIGPKLNGTTEPLDLSLVKRKYGIWKKTKLLLGQVDGQHACQ